MDKFPLSVSSTRHAFELLIERQKHYATDYHTDEVFSLPQLAQKLGLSCPPAFPREVELVEGDRSRVITAWRERGSYRVRVLEGGEILWEDTTRTPFLDERVQKKATFRSLRKFFQS